MARSTDAQKAERLNAAHRLLARGQSLGEVALSMSRQFAMSRRQAYRYIEEAQLIGRPVPVAEAATAVTFKLPPSLVDAVRARAAAEGTLGMRRRDLMMLLAGAVGGRPSAVRAQQKAVPIIGLLRSSLGTKP